MFKPNTTVAWVIKCQDKFLLVEEIDDGVNVLNQPAGHLEEDETLLEAAKRELYEETGLQLEPDFLVGIYQSSVPHKNIQYLRFCYGLELKGELLKTAPQDSDIIQALWLTEAEIKQKFKQHRSHLVQTCINDFIAGKRLPLEYIISDR
ncbi:NUDIX hydrolase [Saccharobesus litoralis]|uniref:Phosphatase NudJ n=1 Tax=Saccharobesus litoralis TaxID=2172099 RepID=A0A2S0VLL6_9ALTE|nr:NUDIX hydrolase [Saccharobesus litoralis]AWB65096.1 NUDIX hydrolase [Saccharobesus litoralis]